MKGQMTLEQYRSSDLCSKLRELLKDEALLIALRVLEDTAPSRNGASIPVANSYEPYIQLGIDRGYAIYGMRLQALAQPLVAKENEVAATYAAEEIEVAED